jgi:8-oxo-dGTP pyrophosphatase MutT (NUDIX family)
VPVFQVDVHLTAVAAQHLTPEALQARFTNPPAWQPELVRERMFKDRAPTQAAVLLGLVMRDEPTVLLTQRPAHMSTHAGQIAFAGGKCDEGDANAAATALREAPEEVGLDARHVKVLGTLPQYVTGSAFSVTPVVALISPAMTLQINTHEVSDAFEVPLAFLMNPAHHRWHRHTFEGVTREWLSMPYQDGSQQRFVWGATAGMLRNFYRFLQA